MLQGIGRGRMQRLIVEAVLKLCGKAILFAVLGAIVVGILGILGKWPGPLEYSNAFFIAGSLLIVAGTVSRLSAGQQWDHYQRIYSESFRSMSGPQRANFIIEASNSVSTLVIGILSGVLLVIVSAILVRMV